MKSARLMVTRTAPCRRAKSKMVRSFAPRPSAATSRVRCAVCPSACASATRDFPQHSSMSKYMLFHMQLAQRRPATPWRHSVEYDRGFDLLGRQIIFISNFIARDSALDEIGDKTGSDAGALDHGLAGQHPRAANDVIALHALQRSEIGENF